jgi:hypothetical protein
LLLITSAQHSFLAFRIEDRENTLKRNEALKNNDKKLHLNLIDESVEMMVDLQDRFFSDASACINIDESDLLLTHQIYMKDTNKR